jgi:hypothetical protein
MNIKSSGRKTCVVGFGVFILSTIHLAENILFRESDPISKFYVHNTHQDFVEHLFGKIRMKGGFNVNPSAVQVKYIIRHLLCLAKDELQPSKNGNCKILLENTESLEPEEEEEEDVLIEFHWGGSPDAVEQMIAEDSFEYCCLGYIAGYIVSKISQTICCYPRVCALKHGDNDPLTQQAFQFLKRRESSSPNLCYPSHSVVKLVVASDKFFEREVGLNKNFHCYTYEKFTFLLRSLT